ncbi:hypothetical protein HELRODRAFT_163411 [Helobdella robusta]|uniref:Uncharacterized protein n=1 Tax=Helobdella robusta TaxID=6412 RepID=T1EU05_HELRO|nr:hypothetical protein HELRODRAFT_163411 [Helobdella robusta]ESN96356.1 hypothetical protein HELRODRAFT_163411 [Helobdella robusta]
MTKKRSLATRKTTSRVETHHNENVISRHTEAANFSTNNISTFTKMHVDSNCASTPKNVRRPLAREVGDYSPNQESIEVGWDSPTTYSLRTTGKSQPGGTAMEYASMMSSISSDANQRSPTTSLPPQSSSSDNSSPIMKLRYTIFYDLCSSLSPILRLKKEAALNSKTLVLSVINALNAVAAEEAKKIELPNLPKLNLEKNVYSEERNCTTVTQSLSMHSTPKMKRVARPLTDIDNLCATPTHNCHNHFHAYPANNKPCNRIEDNNNYNKNKRVRISDASNASLNELMDGQADERTDEEKVNDSAWGDEDSLFGDSIIEATQRMVDDLTSNNILNVNAPVPSTTNSLILNNKNDCTTSSTEASIKMLRKKANLVGASSSSGTSTAHTSSSNCFVKPVMSSSSSSSTSRTTHVLKNADHNSDRRVLPNKTSNYESISDVSISDDLLISSYLPTDNLLAANSLVDDTIVPAANSNDLDTLSFNSALNKLNNSSFSDKQKKEDITNINGTVITSSTSSTSSSSAAAHQTRKLIPKQLKMQQKSKSNQLVYQQQHQQHKQQPVDMSPELFNSSTCEETDMLEFLDLVESQVDPIKSKQKLESAFNSVVNYLEAAGNNRCTNMQADTSRNISTTPSMNTKTTTPNFQRDPNPNKNIFSSNSISIKSSSFYPVRSSNSIKNNTSSTAPTLGKPSLLPSHPEISSTLTFTSSANNSSRFATSKVHIAPPTSNVSHTKNSPAVPHITSSAMLSSSVTITTKSAFLTKNNSAFFNSTCTNNNTRSNYNVTHLSSALVPSSSSRVILQPVSKQNGLNNNNNRYNSMNNISNNNNSNKKDNIFSRKCFSSDNIKPTLQFHGSNTNSTTNMNEPNVSSNSNINKTSNLFSKVCTAQQKQQQTSYNSSSSIKVCYTTEEIERKRREAVIKLTARSQVKHC